MQIRFFLFTTF